jgi:hypothetical protein
MPTLGEFIAHAKRYGFSKRRIQLAGPKGVAFLDYLWRDFEHFVGLPDVPSLHRLERGTVLALCRRLGIPSEDFGLEDNF